MRWPKSIAAGLGSRFTGRKFDPAKALEQARDNLIKNQGAMEFVNSEGWHRIHGEYQKVKLVYWQRLRELARDASTNRRKIQQLSNLIEAMDNLEMITDGIVEAYNRAHKTEQKITKLNNQKPGIAV